jgi:predicted nucleic acid-binding Zn ribbon protein
MKRLNNSQFVLLSDIIKDMNFDYKPETCQKLKNLQNAWEEIVGNKISQFSKVHEFSTDNILTVTCADSFISNELYLVKEKLLPLMNEKVQELGIEIKDIKFNYTKWEERNNE